MPTVFAEYIWIDGSEPTRTLRSKTKVIPDFRSEGAKLSDFPDWGFDGSSTNQAEGQSSDCHLKPVAFVRDPIRVNDEVTVISDRGIAYTHVVDHYLVLCEVFMPDGTTPHPTNTRAKVRGMLEAGADSLDAWFGLEQEYTLFKGSRPLGFGEDRRYPAEQGPYYCGVGADEVYGRNLVEAHMRACAYSGLKISGINAEVMPGQWEFQIGPAGPLEVGDHIWFARWLLYRIGEEYGISATLDPKPVPGDWNGAGMHTNFSTQAMRQPNGNAEGHDKGGPRGMDAITAWCEEAGNHIDGHLAAYGHGYEMRLTGRHETARYDQFGWGVSDRTKSIRIPLATAQQGYGYLEDRRPNANADPYEVVEVMLKTATKGW